MKTTVEISDVLLHRAKQMAAERQQTLKSILESALRQYLDSESSAQKPFKLRKCTYGGRGLRPPLAEGDWASISSHIYAGRGE